MRAVVLTEPGSSATLTLVEREPGEPRAGEVRVRVVRSAVNPTDWKARSTGSRFDRAWGEMVPNQDGAGVIDAVGADVQGFAVGDRVWVMGAAHGRPTGTAQEFTVLPAERVAALPDNASFDVGADLGVPAITAHRALTTSEGGPSRLSPGALSGRTVLVAGGAGAVGNAAIQLARWAGATVISTISTPAKAALAQAAGAEHTVNYRDEDVVARVRELAPDGVDIVVEVSPAKNLAADLKLIKPQGTIAVYANDGGNDVTLDVMATFATNARLQFVLLYTVAPAVWRAAADDINSAITDGAFGVGEEHGLPLHHFPLERAADAHDAVESGVVGKVLIDVSEHGEQAGQH